MEETNWYDGHSDCYVQIVEAFVEHFGDAADIKYEEPNDPEQDEGKPTIADRNAVSKFIEATFPDESDLFDVDVLGAINIRQKQQRNDDQEMYGQLQHDDQ